MIRIEKSEYRASLAVCTIIFIAFASGSCGDATIGDGLADARVDAPSCTPLQTWYQDSDSDGFGDPAVSVLSCDAVPGYVLDDTDCDDGYNTANPDGIEICGDDLDNDCVGGDGCRESLVAHWRFDDGQGGSATDSSDNTNNGTLSGDPTWEGNEYLSFDGVDDHVEVPHDSSLWLDEGTLVLWFLTGDAQRAQGIWSKDSGGYDTGGHFTLSLDYNVDTDVNRLTVRTQDLSTSYYLTREEIEPNTWYHVAITFGPDGLSLRVDNTLEDGDTYVGGWGASTGDAGNLEPIVIGGNTQVSEDLSSMPITEPFVGTIHDVRMYSRALRADEIQDLYTITMP